MQTIAEVGQAVSERRRFLGLKQGEVARRAGIAQEMLSRLERGKTAEFGTRKLLAVLAVLGMELRLAEAAGAVASDGVSDPADGRLG